MDGVDGAPASAGAPRPSERQRMVRKEVAYQLAISGTEAISRRTLRGSLPRGTSRRRDSGLSGDNDVSTTFRDVLRDMEREGWIERGEDVVVILDRDALWRVYATG